MDLAAALSTLFQGLDRAHGRYQPRGNSRPGVKVEGSAVTIRGPVTKELWDRHLAGETGLGVVPIKEDSTAAWGVIDIDVYDNLDHKKIVEDVVRLQLPLIVARTKSGGAHLFLFTDGGVPAEVVRDKLMAWSVALGYAGVEIFPKQVRLADSENDLGNWLNMPYFGGDRSTRYALGEDGTALTPTEFVVASLRLRKTHSELLEIEPAIDNELGDLFEEGPPCLQSIGIHGFPEGSRNNSLFNIGVYLRQRYLDDWEQYLDGYNDRFMKPPLGHREVVAIKKSLNKKDYGYRCSEQPICQACSKAICLTRKYGVGSDESDPGVLFGDLVQVMTEPEVSYIWDVDGVRMEFPNARSILDQRIFHQLAMDRIKKIPNFVNDKIWRNIIRDKLAHAETIFPPEDTTPSGQLWEHLTSFLLQRAQAREIDELLLGRPYVNGELACFRVRDFIDYLRRYRLGTLTEKEIYRLLKERGANPHHTMVKGRMIRYWSVSSPQRQTEEFDVPRATEIDE